MAWEKPVFVPPPIVKPEKPAVIYCLLSKHVPLPVIKPNKPGLIRLFNGFVIKMVIFRSFSY